MHRNPVILLDHVIAGPNSRHGVKVNLLCSMIEFISECSYGVRVSSTKLPMLLVVFVIAVVVLFAFFFSSSPTSPLLTSAQGSYVYCCNMSTQPSNRLVKRYCLCKDESCVATQQHLNRYKGRIPPHDRAREWCLSSTPIAIQFHPQTSNYQSWLLIISICYHIPVFLETFLQDLGNDIRLPTPRQQP